MTPDQESRIREAAKLLHAEHATNVLLAALDAATEEAKAAKTLLALEREFRALTTKERDTAEAALVALREAGRRHERALSGQQNYNWHERDTALLAFCDALASTPADLATRLRARHRAEALRDAADAVAAGGPQSNENGNSLWMEGRIDQNSAVANMLRALADAEEAKP